MHPRAIPNLDPPTFAGEAILLPYAGRVYIPIRKNAHTSIQTAIRNSGQPWYPIPRHLADTYADLPRCCVWRDPLERLESAFAFFSTHTPPRGIPPTNAGFEAWVYAVCDIHDEDRDPHLRSQWATVTAWWPERPHQIFKWDPTALCALLAVGTPPKINVTDKPAIDWTYGMINCISDAYTPDFDIWESL